MSLRFVAHAIALWCLLPACAPRTVGFGPPPDAATQEDSPEKPGDAGPDDILVVLDAGVDVPVALDALPARDATPDLTLGSCPDASPDVPRPLRADVMTLATAGPGGTLMAGQACDPADNRCAPGLLCCRRCCLHTATPVCTAPDREGSCPLPDVTIDAEYLLRSIRFDTRTFGPSACEIAERCIEAAGTRRLLHFAIRIPNMGSADMHLGAPTRDNPNFNFVNCHGHVHYEGYGQYRLLDRAGCVVARGHKSGFCVMDLARVTPGAGPQRYGCSNMGISVGWADIYGVGTGCQWIDVTGVPPGQYLIEASVNPDLDIAESDYRNNTVLVPVTVPPAGAPLDAGVADGGRILDAGPPGAVTDPCPGGRGTGLSSDCGWTVQGTHTCTPGASVAVGCNDRCPTPTGRCTGDPMIRVCVGPGPACSNATALGTNDDACGTLCPLVTVTCPATGRIVVLTAPYMNRPATCELAVREASRP